MHVCKETTPQYRVGGKAKSIRPNNTSSSVYSHQLEWKNLIIRGTFDSALRILSA